jgi:predicted esterase
MRSRTVVIALSRGLGAALALGFAACASRELPPPPHPDPPLLGPAASARPPLVLASVPPPPVAEAEALAREPVTPDSAAATVDSEPEPATVEAPAADASAMPAAPAARCANVPPLLPNGAVPPAPPHAPLGQDVSIRGDRPAYVLPGEAGDPRVIVYLPGMCGDATAADHFREAARAHGTLIAVRGDTPCDNGRFKWRDDPAKIQARIRVAFEHVNAERGGDLRLEQALLFGYSQGADRAEKVAALYPKQYPRVVLGGPPLKPSPTRLAHARRVVVLGGELETTANMRAGLDALQAAGIVSRFVTLECAYHGYFGTSAEAQLTDVLDWVSLP